MKYMNFKTLKVCLFTLVVVNILPHSSTYSMEKPHEPVDRKQLEKLFVSEFYRIMEKTMFGDGSDPIVMPPPKNISAQKYFTRVLERKPQLKKFAQNLIDVFRDLRQSQESKMSSTKSLILEELKGNLPPDQGYATDYIPLHHEMRSTMLAKMLETLQLMKLPDYLRTNFNLNFKYDLTSIDHLIKQFSTNLSSFKYILEYFEGELLVNKASLSKIPKADIPFTGGELEYYNRLIAEVEVQVVLFTYDFFLMEIEKEEQICQLFIPLFQAMQEDSNTLRALKNQDKETYQTMIDLRNQYANMCARLKGHKEKFDFERKRKTSTSNKQGEAQGVQALPEPSTVPAVEVKSKTRTNTKKKRSKARSTQHNNNSSPTVQEMAPHSSEDHLTEWLMNVSPPQTRKHRGPSEQDLKQERKKQAKDAKRKQAEVASTEGDICKDKDELTKSVETKESSTTKPLPIFRLKGNFSLFEEIMSLKYTGEMDSIQLLIKNGFGGLVYLSHGRWHFALPHISENQANVFTTTLDVLEEDEGSMLSSSSNNRQPQSAVTTIHNPHKNKSKRLRPYHVRDIKELFERGGYTLETVKDARVVESEDE